MRRNMRVCVCVQLVLPLNGCIARVAHTRVESTCPDQRCFSLPNIKLLGSRLILTTVISYMSSKVVTPYLPDVGTFK